MLTLKGIIEITYHNSVLKKLRTKKMKCMSLQRPSGVCSHSRQLSSGKIKPKLPGLLGMKTKAILPCGGGTVAI